MHNKGSRLISWLVIKKNIINYEDVEIGKFIVRSRSYWCYVKTQNQINENDFVIGEITGIRYKNKGIYRILKIFGIKIKDAIEVDK